MTNSFSIVFPGQGSQSVGMLAGLAESFSCVTDTFAEASESLGFDLWDLVQNGPEDKLGQTENTQPTMLAAGVAVWRAWKEAGGPKPALMAGHSLGEYTALVCAGAMPFGEAIALVAERGRLMQSAVPEGQGAMAAILGLTDDDVRSHCAMAANGAVVEAVNFNSPGQVVIAGDTAAVTRAMALCKEGGAKRALKLQVSVPSHCALMRPAAEQLLARLAGISISTPEIPVIHNVNVSTESEPARIRELLSEQLFNPVRWVETIQSMAGQGISTVVEAGPGKVLAGLVKRTEKSLTGIPVFDAAGIEKAKEVLS